MKWLFAMILLVIVLTTGCTQQAEIINLAKVDRISLIIRNHLTENNVTDGKVVYILLVSNGKILDGNIKNLTINIVLKGLDSSGKYSMILLNRTYENVSYFDINLPDRSEWPEYKKGFIIYYNEIENYEDFFIGIFVKVILPDEKIIKSSEVEPPTFLVYGYD